jgi:hypothetical protein
MEGKGNLPGGYANFKIEDCAKIITYTSPEPAANNVAEFIK